MASSQTTKFTLEQHLLLMLLSPDPSRDERLDNLLQGEIDWSTLCKTAIQHGVFPLCFNRLFQMQLNQLPAEVFTKMEMLIQANTENNLRLTWKLLQCVSLLKKNGIDSLTLKGPILALQAFGDLKLRQFSDLDILIHSKDFSHAYDILVGCGYIPDHELGDTQKKYLIKTDNQFLLKHQGDEIELHWKIAPEENLINLTQNQLWNDASAISVNEVDMLTLSQENTLLLLALHGAKHGWNQLKWIADFAYLSMTIPETSYITLLDHARQNGLLRQVCIGFSLAEKLLNCELRPNVKGWIRTDHQVQNLTMQVVNTIFTHPVRPTQFVTYKFYLQSRERWRDRFYYLTHLIFAPKTPDWRSLMLPENLYFLYYFVRPIRQFWLMLNSFSTHFRHDT